jgi:excisionase family DNA binding protein
MENIQPDMPEQPEFLTVKQAARYLSISPSCVYRLCATNKLTHYKFVEGRGAVRIRREDLLDFVQRCRIEKQEYEVTNGKHQKPAKQTGYVCKHIDLRPQHACGAKTKAGTPCTRLTRDERCPQHQAGTKE